MSTKVVAAAATAAVAPPPLHASATRMGDGDGARKDDSTRAPSAGDTKWLSPARAVAAPASASPAAGNSPAHTKKRKALELDTSVAARAAPGTGTGTGTASGSDATTASAKSNGDAASISISAVASTATNAATATVPHPSHLMPPPAPRPASSQSSVSLVKRTSPPGAGTAIRSNHAHAHASSSSYYQSSHSSHGAGYQLLTSPFPMSYRAMLTGLKTITPPAAVSAVSTAVSDAVSAATSAAESAASAASAASFRATLDSIPDPVLRRQLASLDYSRLQPPEYRDRLIRYVAEFDISYLGAGKVVRIARSPYRIECIQPISPPAPPATATALPANGTATTSAPGAGAGSTSPPLASASGAGGYNMVTAFLDKYVPRMRAAQGVRSVECNLSAKDRTMTHHFIFNTKYDLYAYKCSQLFVDLAVDSQPIRDLKRPEMMYEHIGDLFDY